MDGDPQAHANAEANASDPAIRAFLDDIWSVYKRHDLALDRMSPEEPMLIRRLVDQDEEFLRESCDTTSPNFNGT
jgi:hypothetical protein